MEVSMGYDFTYESSGLEGVEFELRAAETIYSRTAERWKWGEAGTVWKRRIGRKRNYR